MTDYAPPRLLDGRGRLEETVGSPGPSTRAMDGRGPLAMDPQDDLDGEERCLTATSETAAGRPAHDARPDALSSTNDRGLKPVSLASNRLTSPSTERGTELAESSQETGQNADPSVLRACRSLPVTPCWHLHRTKAKRSACFPNRPDDQVRFWKTTSRDLSVLNQRSIEEEP